MQDSDFFTLPAALRRTVQHAGGRPAIVDDEATFTWEQFAERVARAAGLLTGLGLAPGERFAIFARNGFRVEELMFAGYRAAIIPVPVNWRLAPPEIEHVLEDCGCRHIFVDRDFLPVFEAESLAPWRDRLIPLTDGSDDGLLVYDDLRDGTDPAPAHRVDPDDDAVLLYTGGTTGRSKGVRLSHANIVSNALAFGLGVGARPDDVYLHVAPMFHSADLLATAWVLVGAAHAYVPVFTPAAFLSAIERYRVTAMTTVPTMWMMTLPAPEMASADLSGVRTLIYGASPMAVEWMQRLGAALPDADIFNSYGLTETAPDLTYLDPGVFRRAVAAGDREGPIRSVGKPNPLVELKVVDAAGTEVARGEAGELRARGPNIMKGYLNLPELTVGALVDGWLRTGDIARIDEAGYVYLLDRAKDMIISGGENVYCSEIEAALYQHPAVVECAAIGVPDERLGERVFAVVTLAPGAEADETTLVAHCRERIAGYKVPRGMAFVDAMPKSALGKILKAELRRRYGAGPREGRGASSRTGPATTPR